MNCFVGFACFCFAASLTLLAVNARAQALKSDDVADIKTLRTIGDVIANAQNKPVHIVFVHGMRATGRGNSRDFMNGLAAKYKNDISEKPASDNDGNYVPTSTHIVNLGDTPDENVSTLYGREIWPRQDHKDWIASRPFVDRYIFKLKNASSIVVDEVNWWPLLFPLKCRQLVMPEVRLSGVDGDDLRLCNRSDPPYFKWISDEELATALQGPKASGGGVLLNALGKQQIMNWGLADAVIVLGPMHKYFQDAMEDAFGFARTLDGKTSDDQEFVIISESLGSFVVMDAAYHRTNSKAVVYGSADIYFFANQFALLELGRIGGTKENADFSEDLKFTGSAGLSPMSLLDDWAKPQSHNFSGGEPGFIEPTDGHGAPKLKQIIAFNDPSDLLTYNVPPLKAGGANVLVANIYDHNGFNWFGFFKNPATAHTGHSKNSEVLKFLFSRSRSK